MVAHPLCARWALFVDPVPQATQRCPAIRCRADSSVSGAWPEPAGRRRLPSVPTDLLLTDKTRETRDKLLRVARAVFEEDGFDVRERQPHRRAAPSVSRGTFYLYFESKEDIFRTLAEDDAGPGRRAAGPLDGADRPAARRSAARSPAFVVYYRGQRQDDGRPRAGGHLRPQLPVTAAGHAPGHRRAGRPVHQPACSAVAWSRPPSIPVRGDRPDRDGRPLRLRVARSSGRSSTRSRSVETLTRLWYQAIGGDMDAPDT